MWFRVAIDRLVVALLPGFLRNPALAAFVQALVYPIAKLYDTWHSWREQNLYKLRHTGQVGSLRQALNDGLDPEERRIAIMGSRCERNYIYTAVEKKPYYLGKMYLHPSTDYAYKGIDFIVYVPEEIMREKPFQLKALLDLYRPASKHYKILIYG